MRLQGVYGLHELGIGRCTERSDTYISHTGAYHVVGIDRIYGYLGSCHVKVEQFVDATAFDAELDFRTAGSAQTSHYLRTFHLYARNGGVGNGDYAVAGEYSYLL